MNIAELKSLVDMLTATGASSLAKILLVLTVLVGVAWRIGRKYLLQDKPFNLQTPTEHRLRQLLSNVQEQAITTTDPFMVAVMADERSRLQFQLLHGIDAKASLREDLVGLYNLSGPRVSWGALRQALPYFRYQNGRIVPGVERLDVFFSWLLLVSAVMTMLLGVMVGLSSYLQSGAASQLQDLIAVLVVLPFLFGGYLLTLAATPALRAQQLQMAIKHWHGRQPPLAVPSQAVLVVPATAMPNALANSSQAPHVPGESPV